MMGRSRDASPRQKKKKGVQGPDYARVVVWTWRFPTYISPAVRHFPGRPQLIGLAALLCLAFLFCFAGGGGGGRGRLGRRWAMGDLGLLEAVPVNFPSDFPACWPLGKRLQPREARSTTHIGRLSFVTGPSWICFIGIANSISRPQTVSTRQEPERRPPSSSLSFSLFMLLSACRWLIPKRPIHRLPHRSSSDVVFNNWGLRRRSGSSAASTRV